ncbi:MAG TPA: FG-GAP-like repeat-containing protein, partial [Thermoanaerobaculia bacterium]
MPMARVLCLFLTLSAFFSAPPSQSPGDRERIETEKNVGLAALEEGQLAEAQKRFEAVRRLAPQEPLGWANGAIAAMRSKDLAGARRLLAEAEKLAPRDARVAALQGVLEEQAENIPGAVQAYEKAAAADPKDLSSRWSAARLLAEKVAGGRPRAITAVQAALQVAPANTFLLARQFDWEQDSGDRAGIAQAWERFARALDADARADPKIDKYLQETKSALDSGDAHNASLKFRIVENLLRPTPRYQQARRDVEPGVIGLPLEDWSASMPRMGRVGGKGVAVKFVEKPTPSLSTLEGLAGVGAGGHDGRDVVFAGARGITIAHAREGFRLDAPVGGPARTVEVADITNSGELDLVTPGALWVSAKGGFSKTPLPPGERVLPIDFDSDGDLDLYVSNTGGDKLLRNNLDGTWTDVTASALPKGLASRWAVASDFDRDGDPDLVLARSEGGLVLLDNLRGGRFAEREAGLPGSGRVLALAAGDLNADGRPDLVWTTETAAFVALNRGDGTFLPAKEIGAGGEPLLFDFDNDGALDLLLASASGTSLWRNDGSGSFSRVGDPLPAAVAAEAVDIDGDGDLDLVLVTPRGRAVVLENQGGNANGWIDVALEGLATGSAKVNRFGYGSEIEVKAGELYVFRTASRPVTHAGIGSSRRADVLRIIWTNGIPQNTLSPPVKTLVKEVQQLKGSCPFVYAYDGRHWSFITDALGRSPVGLLYDGVHQAKADTREWLLISGERARPVEGRVVLELTEELWETVYFDLAELRAVDHPAGVAIVPDEKMVPPPFPPKALYTISHPLVPKAVDEKGRDRTEEIAREDGRYLAGFEPTRYQGIVEDHALVLDLPEARRGGRVMLFLTGWIFYSDTSINVSLSQGGAVQPFGPVLEVPDGGGRWRVAIPAMGYPAGKTKTMPIDLSDVLSREDPRVRIRTNLAIYWDRIAYTVGEKTAPTRISDAPLESARLSG